MCVCVYVCVSVCKILKQFFERIPARMRDIRLCFSILCNIEASFSNIGRNTKIYILSNEIQEPLGNSRVKIRGYFDNMIEKNNIVS